MLKRILFAMFLCAASTELVAQESNGNDSLPFKNLHAEPLYIDLIRDLGARKGEREWNVGLGLTDQQDFDEYQLLVEYEWAPINRLGLEVEVPFTLYYKSNENSAQVSPSNRVEGIKTAVQWSFFVSEQLRMTTALGYLNEIKFTDLNKISTGPLFKGNLFNPFFVAAKRIGANFHSLIYTGLQVFKPFRGGALETGYDLNTSFHYMIPSSRNFVGVEINKQWEGNGFDMTIRPQLRLAISDNLLLGIVTGVPISRENERFSSFMRLIYEPSHRKPRLRH